MKALTGFMVVAGVCLGLATLIAPIVAKIFGIHTDGSVGDAGCCGSVLLVVLALVLDSGRKP